ncbi:PEP-utilizing enzyme [Nocardia sp. NBC_00416]|uniref:PEP-utilizing enzyme n=1 Tax=Nocardia sp. NBC_00416 TaxID=2975991 RepID=UPI002E1B1073
MAPGEARIWDDADTVENFPPSTSPLTFTTAAGLGGRVCQEYARSLGVPEAQVRQLDSWTPYLLGTFHDRVYYNLLHWYRLAGIAPGNRLNRSGLEAVLGLAGPLPDEIAATLSPFTFETGLRRARSRTRTAATYLRRMFGIDAMTREFHLEFGRFYDRYDALEPVHGEHAYATYRRVDRDLVLRWGPMLVLDAVSLTLTGVISRLTEAFLPEAPAWFRYAVTGPGAAIGSAEPVRALTELARHAYADPDLAALVTATEPGRIRQSLRDRGYQEFVAEIDAYLERYGYLSVGEWALESPDLREEPAGLFLLLRGELARVGARDGAVDPDAYLDERLSGPRRWIFDRVRSKAVRCAAHRESVRFCRARAFAVVKRMVRVMGDDLAARGLLGESTDVFYLTVGELHGCYDQVPMADLRERVAARKDARIDAARLVAPAHFTTVGPGLSDAELAAQGWIPRTDIAVARDGEVLTGTPSAPGVVDDAAVVLDEPCAVTGGILVAHRADPGWAAALPSASALVLERGGPFTRVAVAARELGVPTVVRVPQSSRRLRTGMRIRVDGAAGTVTVLSGGGRASVS